MLWRSAVTIDALRGRSRVLVHHRTESRVVIPARSAATDRSTTRSTIPERAGSRQSRRARTRAGSGRRSRRIRSSRSPDRATRRRSTRARARGSPPAIGNVPSSRTFHLKKWLTAPGNVSGDRVDRFVLAAIAIGRPRVDQHASRVDRPRWPSRRPSPSTRRAAPLRNGAAAASRRPIAAAGLSPIHFAKPPSSTATASCPIQRSSHHSRLAYMPLSWSYATTCTPPAMPSRPNVCARRRRIGQRMTSVAAVLLRPTGRDRGSRTPRPGCVRLRYSRWPQASSREVVAAIDRSTSAGSDRWSASVAVSIKRRERHAATIPFTPSPR